MSIVYIGTGLYQTIIYTKNWSKIAQIKIQTGKKIKNVLYMKERAFDLGDCSMQGTTFFPLQMKENIFKNETIEKKYFNIR